MRFCSLILLLLFLTGSSNAKGDCHFQVNDLRKLHIERNDLLRSWTQVLHVPRRSPQLSFAVQRQLILVNASLEDCSIARKDYESASKNADFLILEWLDEESCIDPKLSRERLKIFKSFNLRLEEAERRLWPSAP